MSSTTTTTSRQDATRSAAAATVGGAIALNALGIFGDGTAGAEHSAGEFWIMTALILVAAALVFGIVVRRFAGTPRAGTAGLVLALLGVLLVVPAFWSGLPVVLGAGGLMLGLGERREAGAIGSRVCRDRVRSSGSRRLRSDLHPRLDEHERRHLRADRWIRLTREPDPPPRPHADSAGGQVFKVASAH